MQSIFTNKKVVKNCKIATMLQGQKRHLSFHTPGHKQAGWDITELSYSDNLSCPQGCIEEAERDIAAILGSAESFLLTDGSTSGVYAMLHAAKALGVQAVAVSENAHKSVFNGCKLLGITPLVYSQEKRNKIPFPPTVYALKKDFADILKAADALFLTSPDYYGNVSDLFAFREYCNETGKLLFIDGAHGAHLHFDKSLHAGAYADFWVDGVHKSLPCYTQGSVVSARTRAQAEKLAEAVDVFRTTSPSYPIMAAVEYAIKYPRNQKLEKAVRNFAQAQPRVCLAQDWTKVCALFGKNAFTAQTVLEKEGIFAEFCDGNVLMFYLSPATKFSAWKTLEKRLKRLFKELSFAEHDESKEEAREELAEGAQTEQIPLQQAEGRLCALPCGLFPPCTPLLCRGERITEEKITLLQSASGVYGLRKGKITVIKE